eukprot:5364097-Pyramimonas_sp.AAC.1
MVVSRVPCAGGGSWEDPRPFSPRSRSPAVACAGAGCPRGSGAPRVADRGDTRGASLSEASECQNG